MLRSITIGAIFTQLFINASPVFADSMPFAAWGSEIADIIEYQTSDNAQVSDDAITAVDTSKSFTATYTIDVSSISASIDTGEAELDYSYDCQIVNEGDGQNDTAQVVVTFQGTSESQTHPCDVTEQGKADHAITIPAHTTAIDFSFTGTVVGTANTVKFKDLSFVIDDKIAPRLEIESTPALSGGATIAITASEGGSGLSSVYYAAGEQTADYFPGGGTEVTTSSGSGSAFVPTGGTYTVYAVDYRGNNSVKTIDVNTYPVIGGLGDQTVPEDTPLSFSLTITDGETPAASLTVTAASSNSNLVKSEDIHLANIDGLVSVNFTPLANANGSGQLTFTVTDGGGLQRDATINLTVTAVNDAPVANADSARTNEETAVDIDVLANDTNPDQGTLTVDLVGAPSSGIARVNENGTISYTPAPNFTGDATFNYQITDSNGGDISQSMVTVTVDAVDDAPTAGDDSATLEEDSSVSIDVLANDSDPEGDAFSIIAIGTPEHGSAVWDGEHNQVIYTPASNYFGADSFSYTISEIANPALQTTAQVQIEVSSVNDAPAPSYSAAISTDEDTAATQSISATDVDGDTLTFFVKDGNQPVHGSLELREGEYTYTPAENYTGSDGFTITVSDGITETDCAITVTVSPVNDLPVPTYQASITTDEDTPVSESLTATDIDGDTLTYALKEGSEPAHGSLELADGGYTYTPDENYHGDDGFTITVSDGTGSVDCAISVTINEVNDAPLPTYQAAVSVNEDATLNETLSVTDADGDEITREIKAGSEPHNGALTLGDGGYTYTPNANFNGGDAFTITVSDGTVAVDCMISVTVNPVNDAPVPLYENAISTDEDTATNQSLTASDVDLDPLNYLVKEGNEPTHGTLTITASGYTYTPAADYHGSDNFTITVSDGTTEVNCPVTVTVNSANDAPVPEFSAEVSTDEDTTYDGTISAADVDLDTLSFSVKEGNGPAHGSLELTDDGYTYTPAADYNGSDAFTITVSDGTVEVDCGISVTVNPINDAPEPVFSASVSTDEDTALHKPLTASDADGDALTYAIKDGSGPAHGTLELNDGGYTYTPAENYHGDDNFVVTVSDGTLVVDCAIAVTVNSVNDLPVPEYTASISTDEDTPDTQNLTATDVDGDTLTYSIKSGGSPAHGTLELIDGGYTYSPSADFNGSDSFVITVSDGTDAVDCTIAATVYAVNDAPVPAYTASISTDEDTPTTQSLTATDVDLDKLSFTVTSGNGPSHGTLELTDGGYTYTPDENYNGSDSFTITVSDGHVDVPCAVSVTVNAVNDSPVAADDSATTNEDTSVSVSVLANDSDVDIPEGDSIVPSRIVVQGAHGTASISGTNIVYSPSANYFGSDEFTYEIIDEGGLTATAKVSLTINAVNDYPQAEGLLSSYTIDEDSSITISFDLTDVETPAETLTMQVVTGNTAIVPQTRITISGLEDTNPATSIKLVPLANQNGDVTFTIRASDGFQTAVYTFTLHVTPVNDAPTARSDSIGFTEDTAKVINISSQLLANDTDIDDTQSSLVFDGIVSSTTSGTLVNNGDGTLTYTPPANFDTSDNFTYRIHDPSGATSTATVTLVATRVNDPPTISAIDDQVVDEDGTVAVNFTVSDADLDSEAELNTLIITTYSTNPDLLDVNNMRISGSGANRTFTAAPLADKNGSLNVSITVSDGITEVSEAFQITINAVPDAPMAEDDFFYIQNTGSFAIDPLANDWDADGDTGLTPAVVTAPSYGTLETSGDTYVYTPGESFDGGDSFTYTVTDSTDRVSRTATVTLSADPNNWPPVISSIDNQVIFEDESGSVSFTVTDEDENLEGVTISSSNTTLFPDGSLDLSSSGSDYTLDYAPAANQFGKAILIITASDARGNVITKCFSIRVAPINDLPTANDDNVTTNEDTNVTFNVLSNDTDMETATANLLLRKITSSPSHGRLLSLGSGTFRYIPNLNYNGSDSFSYEMIDADGGVDQGLVAITINSVNDAPIAYDNNLTTIVSPGGTLDNINAIGNDTDPDLTYDANEEIHVTRIVSQPACGTASVNADGSLKYEAFGSGGNCTEAWQSFRYEIADHYGATASAAIILAVDTTSTDLAPHTYSIWRSIQEDAATITIDLSSYSFDPDGDTLTYSLNLASAPNTSLGTATISGSIVSYTPGANKNGTYSDENFQYTVTDGTTTATGRIYIEIIPVNDPPTISMQTDAIVALPDQSIDENSSMSLDFYINDVDINESGLTLADLGLVIYSDDTRLVPPASIAVTRDGGGGSVHLTITPVEFAYGSTNITVLATDGITYTTDKFKLDIEHINNPPVASDHNVTSNEDETAKIDVVDYLANVDGDTITVSLGSVSPQHGTLTFDQSKGDAIYTPFSNFYGNDSFEFILTDSGGLTDAGMVYITVKNVNDPPDVYDVKVVVETAEDTSVSTAFKVADIDTDLADISLSAVSSNTDLVKSFSFTKSTDGSGAVTLTVVPADNASGTATIEISANDGDKTDSESFMLKVYAVNDPPVAGDDAVTINEDNSIRIDVIANDTDVEDPDTIYVVSVSSPKLLTDGSTGHGTVVNNNDGTITYTPGANRNDDIYFTYEISDSGNLRDTGKVTVTINAVDDVPSVVNDSRSIVEDNTVTIPVLSNDSDIEGDTFSIYSYTNPAHGSVSLDIATQSFTYVPTLNYNGTDSFTYTVAEDLDLSKRATATVTISISSVDDYPIISTTEPWVMYEDTSGTFAVSISDAETASANLLITFTSLDTNLIKSYNVILQGSGTSRTVKLTPVAQMNGSLQLKVDVNDGALTTTELIDIIIMPVNDPPVAQNYTVSVEEDSSVSGIDVVKSDIDLLHEGDSFTYSLGSQGAHGTAVVAADGNWIYTPNANFNGTDQFTVTITDSGGATATSTVTVTVTKVNDTPQVTSANANVLDEDTSVTDTIVVSDPDLSDSTDPDSYTVQVTTDPQHGTVVMNSTTGVYKYTPATNYNGSDSFVVKVTDEHSAEISKTVAITVNPVNDAPVAEDDRAAISEDGSAAVSVLANDSDIDISREGDSLFASAVSGVDNGTATISEDKQSITFTPNANWSGTETFTYTVKDQHGATDTADVTITVSAVNDAPVISDVTNQTINEDTNTGAISFTISDVDTAATSLTVTAATSNGTVIPSSNIVLGGSGSNRTVTITPLANKNTWVSGTSSDQPVTITLTVGDGSLTASDTFTVTVAPVNDAPVAGADTASATEDSSGITISVLANDTDIDISNEGDALTIQSVAGVDNATVTIITSGSQLSYKPDANWNGTEVFTYTVVDSKGATATANVTVTVSAVNDAPVISDVVNQTILEDSTTGAISFTVSDVDNTATSLTVTRASSNSTVIPAANIVLGGSGSSRTVTVTPVANKNTWNKTTSTNQPVTITLTVSDGKLTATDTFTVTVTPVNDAPDAVNDTASATEDGNVTISVLTNDTDVDIANEGDSISVYSTSGVDNGTATISADLQTITFTPAADFNGSETFSYTIHDSHGAEDTATVIVTVAAVNDAPVISDTANQTINEDTNTGVISFTVSDVDTSTSALTVTAVSDNQTVIPNANVVLSGSGNTRYVTVTPLSNKNTWVKASGTQSPVTITLTVSDGALTKTDTFTVTVTPVNDPPDAVDDSATIAEDNSTTLLVLSNDTDIDLNNEGDNLTITAVSEVDNATVIITDGGKSLSFKPSDNWNGSETFKYTITDAGGSSDSAYVTVTVTAVNDAPDAVDDSVMMDEDGTQKIEVLKNDTDADIAHEGDTLTIVSVGTVSHGTLSITDSGKTLTYTPTANWSGTEVFNYTINDTRGGSDTATVTVIVNPVEDIPVAGSDTFTMLEDAGATSLNVMSNDSDADVAYGDSIRIDAITANPQHGSISIDSVNQRIIYTPDANYNGVDSFTYRVKDANTPAGTATALVSLTITSVNDLPVVTSTNSHSIQEDQTASGTVTATDVDNNDSPDADSQTFSVSTAAGHGKVELNSTSGSYTYTPDANYNGSDSFIVLVSDERGGSAHQTVTISIAAVNDAPQADDASYNTPEDVAVNKTIAAVDPDVATNADVITYAVTTAPLNGVLILNSSTGEFTYTPDTNYNGMDTFKVKVTDKAGANDSATISIYVNYYENDPSAATDEYTIDEDAATTSLDVLKNDDDADLPYGDVLYLVDITSGPAHGSAVINSTAQKIEYTPDANFNGSDGFTYRIKDNQDPAVYASANVTVTVNPINDVPVITSESSVDVLEDATLNGKVTFTDPDVDDYPNPDSHLFYTEAGPQHGTLYLNQYTGEYQYIPNGNYNGSDHFTIRVTDSHEASDNQIITVTVLWADDDPVANDDDFKTSEGAGWKTIDVVANDTDADLMYGDTLTITRIITEPAHGTVQISATTNTLRYKPKGGYYGTVTFTYEIRDNQDPEKTASANVTVKVSKVEKDESAPGLDWDDWFSGTQYYGTNKTGGNGSGSNDGGSNSLLLEDHPFTASVGIQGSSYMLDPNHMPANGTVKLSAQTGEFTYTPDADYNGPDSFTILVQQGSRILSQDIELTYTPVNDTPRGSDLQLTSLNGEIVGAALPIGDVDVYLNGDHLTYSLFSHALNGEVNLNPDTGEFTFIPNTGFTGIDHFTVRVQDSAGLYKDCQVTVCVHGEGQKTDQSVYPKSRHWGGFPWIFAGLFFVIIIILIYNVKITYWTIQADGSRKKEVKRYSVWTGKKDEVVLELKREKEFPSDTEVTLLRSFVMRFKGKTLKIVRNGLVIKTLEVEANKNGKLVVRL